MKRKTTMFFALLFLLPALAHAQSGCVSSQENPTALLGLVGSSAGAACYLREKFRRRKNR